MDVCGEAENKLALEQSQHEVQLERDVLEPLNQLAEVRNAKDMQITCVLNIRCRLHLLFVCLKVDIPNILKQRKYLAKLVLDFDSAKARCVHFAIVYIQIENSSYKFK